MSGRVSEISNHQLFSSRAGNNGISEMCEYFKTVSVLWKEDITPEMSYGELEKVVNEYQLSQDRYLTIAKRGAYWRQLRSDFAAELELWYHDKDIQKTY